MYKLLIARIKELQGEKSVSAFARYLEMPQKTVDTYINGERKPSVEFIMRVCSKCHVTSDWLLGLSDVRSPFDSVERETNPKENTQKKEKFSMSICRSVKQYNKHITKPKERQVRKEHYNE